MWPCHQSSLGGPGDGALVRACQPLPELAGGGVRRRAVERHQRGRHAGYPHDVGAPAVLLNWRHLNQIPASSDVFFEPVDGGNQRVFFVFRESRNCTQRLALHKRSG